MFCWLFLEFVKAMVSFSKSVVCICYRRFRDRPYLMFSSYCRCQTVFSRVDSNAKGKEMCSFKHVKTSNGIR